MRIILTRYVCSDNMHSKTTTQPGDPSMTTIWPGKPYPLGATWDGQGVNFALFSQYATGVELCLFDTADAPVEHERIAMPEQTDNVWHVYLPGVQQGQLYGYRAPGPFVPEAGH